jgi:type IV pilus biogenesis protein CpaD/CtpE
MQTSDGFVAIPPGCPSNVTDVTDPYDNQPRPQFGCADARNLAMMAERPEDIVKPRDLGPASGVTSTGAILRYNNNQTRGLIYTTSSPDSAVDTTTANTAASGITGDLTGNYSSGGSSSSSSSSTTSGAASTGTSSSGVSSGSGP